MILLQRELEVNTFAKLYNFFWDSLLWGFPKGRSESGLFSLRLHILSEKGGPGLKVPSWVWDKIRK